MISCVFKPFYLCCVCFFFLNIIYFTLIFTSNTWHFSFFNNFWFLIFSYQHIFTKPLCFTKFLLFLDCYDASSLINAATDVRTIPKLSRKFNLRNSIMFTFSLSLEEYFFILKHSNTCALCKLFIWFIFFHSVLHDLCL